MTAICSNQLCEGADQTNHTERLSAAQSAKKESEAHTKRGHRRLARARSIPTDAGIRTVITWPNVGVVRFTAGSVTGGCGTKVVSVSINRRSVISITDFSPEAGKEVMHNTRIIRG